jgi:putative membrane protein
LNKLLWLLQWMLKAAIFFILFAFALNNQHEAVVHFFFSAQWQAPMVLLLLVAFVLGVAVGVLGMVPRWWRQRQLAQRVPADDAPAQTAHTAPTVTPPAAASAADTLHGL